jgi:hypothetical protein
MGALQYLSYAGGIERPDSVENPKKAQKQYNALFWLKKCRQASYQSYITLSIEPPNLVRRRSGASELAGKPRKAKLA